jgi:hypothetical protein
MLLMDARLYVLLLKFDEDLAAEIRRGRCQRCGGRLDEGRYPRDPAALHTTVAYGCFIKDVIDGANSGDLLGVPEGVEFLHA